MSEHSFTFHNTQQIILALYLTQGQWRRQRNEGARSFRGQKILEPGQVTRCPGG